jgi:flavorubredoxin
MKTTVTEVAPDIFRICTFVPDIDLQFNQFLVRDDEPLLFHTGMRSLFPAVRDAVASVLDPASLRWISFSHFEADECGSLNEWLALAPRAQAACSFVGAMVSVDDFASRPARALKDEEVFSTGRHRFRFRATPQVPHAWDAGLLFEETKRALFCTDLLHQSGDVEPVTQEDVVARFRATLVAYEAGPLAHYMPYTPRTQPILEGLAALKPQVLLPMHGSAFAGDGARVIGEMAEVLRDVLGGGR